MLAPPRQQARRPSGNAAARVLTGDPAPYPGISDASPRSGNTGARDELDERHAHRSRSPGGLGRRRPPCAVRLVIPQPRQLPPSPGSALRSPRRDSHADPRPGIDLGQAPTAAGEPDQAAGLLREAADILDDGRDPCNLACARAALARALPSEPAEAVGLLEGALSVMEDRGVVPAQAEILESLAWTAVRKRARPGPRALPACPQPPASRAPARRDNPGDPRRAGKCKVRGN